MSVEFAHLTPDMHHLVVETSRLVAPEYLVERRSVARVLLSAERRACRACAAARATRSCAACSLAHYCTSACAADDASMHALYCADNARAARTLADVRDGDA